MSKYDEIKAGKKQQILEAVMEMVKSKGSIINVTVSEIAQQAGIGKGTVYQYFDNKEDLFIESVNHHMNTEIDFIEEIIDRDDIDYTEKISLFVDKITKMVEVNMNAQNMMQQLPALLCENPNLFEKIKKIKDNIDEKYRKITKKIYDCGINEGLIKKKREFVEFTTIVQTITAGMISMLVRNPDYTQEQKSKYKETMKEIIVNLFK